MTAALWLNGCQTVGAICSDCVLMIQSIWAQTAIFLTRLQIALRAISSWNYADIYSDILRTVSAKWLSPNAELKAWYWTDYVWESQKDIESILL